MRASLSPLSPAEQTLAEQNFYMVNRLQWYLLTVKNWFRRPELYKYEFSTIVWKAMSSAVHNERQKQDRRIKTISLDAPIPGTDGLTWGDIVTEDNQNYSIYARSVC